MIWPFSRKPKPLNPGPINEDWRVGDLAECLFDGLFNESGWSPAISKGDVARVISVDCGRTWYGDAWRLVINGFPECRFNAECFRKVPPLNSKATAEFTAQIKGLKPKRVRA